jgi:preprotein translocase subunit SecG
MINRIQRSNDARVSNYREGFEDGYRNALIHTTNNRGSPSQKFDIVLFTLFFVFCFLLGWFLRGS